MGLGIASASNAVKDLRPLRGALSRVLDLIPCSGWDFNYGSAPLPVSERNRKLEWGEKRVLV
jgi:hypothetical protein